MRLETVADPGFHKVGKGILILTDFGHVLDYKS